MLTIWAILFEYEVIPPAQRKRLAVADSDLLLPRIGRAYHKHQVLCHKYTGTVKTRETERRNKDRTLIRFTA